MRFRSGAGKIKIGIGKIIAGIAVLIQLSLLGRLIAIMLCIFMLIGGIAGSVAILFFDEEKAGKKSEDSEWEWDEIYNENGDLSLSGGLYPKDEKLRQLAKFLEVLDTASTGINQELGYENSVPQSLLAITLRETGGRVINELIANPDIDIFTQLIYPVPVCGKGSGCAYCKGGVSHFVGGTVRDGVDMGDPATMMPNTDGGLYANMGKDHALGYFQIEINSIEGILKYCYPSGIYKNGGYLDAGMRYNFDKELGFIRPNICYVPDVVYSVGMSNARKDSIGSGLKQLWGEIEQESWYKDLSARDKVFCWVCVRDIGYQAGVYVSYKKLGTIKPALKFLAGLVSEGYISSMWELESYLESNAGLSGAFDRYYNQNTYKITRPSDNMWIGAWNELLNQSYKGKAEKAKQELIASLEGGRFKEVKGGVNLISSMPAKAFSTLSIANRVYEVMKEQVASAEKEGGGPQVNLGGLVLSRAGEGQIVWKEKNLRTEDLVKRGGANEYWVQYLTSKTKGMWGTCAELSGNSQNVGMWQTSKMKVPFYSQFKSSPLEQWDGVKVGSSTDLRTEGCAFYMFAYVLSAKQRRVINPAEFAVVGHYYGVFTSGGGIRWNRTEVMDRMLGDTATPMRVTGYYRSDFGDWRGADFEKAAWKHLDAALASGYSCGFRTNHIAFTGSNHFMIIEGLTEDGKYILRQTQRRQLEGKAFTRSELYKYMHKSLASSGVRYAVYVFEGV